MMMKSIAGRRLSGGLTRTARAGGRASRSVVTSMSTPLPKEVKTVTPVGGRTFLKLEEVKEETSGGILLPDQAQTKQTQGVVVICDDGLEFKVGQAVVYSKFAGTDVELEGQEHVILKVKSERVRRRDESVRAFPLFFSLLNLSKGDRKTCLFSKREKKKKRESRELKSVQLKEVRN